MPQAYTLHAHFSEVHSFLGHRFRPEWCTVGDAKVIEEFKRYPTPAAFYRETEVYIYHGIGYALSGLKRPYWARLFEYLGDRYATILDYGCGPGQDGVNFIQMLGLPVSFADVPCRSLDFLTWRINWRGLEAKLYELGNPLSLPRHDVVWCMDVLEHLPPAEHLPLLHTLGQLGGTVFVNLVNDPLADGGLHHPVDIEGLTAALAQTHTGRFYDYLNGQVRLLVYGDDLAALLKSTANSQA